MLREQYMVGKLCNASRAGPLYDLTRVGDASSSLLISLFERLVAASPRTAVVRVRGVSDAEQRHLCGHSGVPPPPSQV